MAYTVNTYDKTITVDEGTINNDLSIGLVGRNYFGYGENVAQALATLLENSASAEPDLSKRTTGQLWADHANETLKMWVYDRWVGTTFNQKSLKDNLNGDRDGFVIEAGGLPIAIFSNEEYILHDDEPIKPAFTNGQVNIGMTMAEGMIMYGTALRALYADLAELYASDAEYEPGTVVKIGGEAEVTQTTEAFCTEVFGIVSTNPAYLMNSALEGTTVAVALEGRVPCRVIGEVRKGQRLVASEVPGVARAATEYERNEGLDWFRVVGRALENKDTIGIGLVEVVVGVK
jgi:hypothetical protein